MNENLVNLLNAGKWVDFMDKINDEIGHILVRGKPRQADIDASIVGRSGFSSWTDMIQAPVRENGLGWSSNSFDAWRRAYNLVQKHPFLRSNDLSASKINTIYRETKPNFPASQEALDAHLACRNDEIEQLRQNSLKTAQERTERLEDSLNKANYAVTVIESTNAGTEKRLLAEIQQLNEKCAALNAELLAIKKGSGSARPLLDRLSNIFNSKN